MLTIKLQRIGKKHQAAFRLIVGEKRSKLDGKQLEDLGWFNPHTDQTNFNKERVEYCIKNGAQLTDTARKLLTKSGILTSSTK